MVVKQAVQQADIQVQEPVKQMTTQEKAKAAGFSAVQGITT